LLDDLLRTKQATARVHLLGHSYGGKVVLSATRALAKGGPKVNSMLLLQPAVNGWCFAPDVDGRRFPGGYANVPARVELPVLTTFSTHDFPLTKTFHLAVRRKEDLGELKAATAGRPKPPSEYAALGGFGPSGLSDADCQFIAIKRAGERYDFGIAREVIALNGDEAIAGHGDISVPATWWALHCQVAANR
jgi:pimeloyl-ACP methyl ester carboxylesterase